MPETFEEMFGPAPDHDHEPMTEEEKLLAAVGAGKGGTRWPDAEPPIQKLLDRFWDEMEDRNFPFPKSKSQRNQQKAGARQWVEEYGEGSEDLMVRALSACLSERWVVKSPASLITMARNLRAQGQDKTLSERLREEGYE